MTKDPSVTRRPAPPEPGVRNFRADGAGIETYTTVSRFISGMLVRKGGPAVKNESINRRIFISTTARAGAAVCGLCLCSPMSGLADEGEKGVQKIDLAGRCFCGYKCPEDCPLLQGTLQNDDELKKEAWNEWKLEERFGVAFDPEQAFCFGCKEMDKPMGIVLARCTVRDCAIAKEQECCIDCDELTTCEKDLWVRFPEFKKMVIEAQIKYRAQT